MARFRGVALEVAPDDKTRVARVAVTGTVQFDRYDLAVLEVGLVFDLTAMLWGADQYLIEHPGEYPDPDLVRAPRHDDLLVERLGKRPVARGDVDADGTTRFRLERSVSYAILDEDRGRREGPQRYSINEADELYATVMLASSYTRSISTPTGRHDRNFGRT